MRKIHTGMVFVLTQPQSLPLTKIKVTISYWNCDITTGQRCLNMSWLRYTSETTA